MRVPIPLIGPSYTNRSLPLSSQVTKGFYPEINPESRNIVSLNPFPGLKAFSALSGVGRGLHVMDDILYAVSGPRLYRVDANGTGTDLGIISGTGVTGMADNGTQLMIATGDSPHVYQDTLEVLGDPDVVSPTTVAYLNSQFLLDTNNGVPGRFVTSDPGTTSIDALNFAEAESHPDDISRIVAHNQVAYMFGPKSLEPWFNSGTGSPPWDRIQGGVKPYGLAGRDAIGVSDDFIYFLDNKRIPRRLVGVDVTPIGNPALGAEWAKYSDVSDAVGMTFTLDQQNFFQLNFPTADRTWLYHEPSNQWTQLSYGVNNARHRAMSYVSVYGKDLVQDHSNGKIYELDQDTYTDDGAEIQRVRSTATIEGKLYDVPGEELFFDRVEFILQTGEGTPTGQGQTPVLMVRHSDDGGRTWSAENSYDLGVGGDYLQRVVLQNQGSAFQRIYELKQTDPVPMTLIAAHADIEVGLG